MGANGNYYPDAQCGNIPSRSEVDVPLTYADYYFVEALMRLRKFLETDNYEWRGDIADCGSDPAAVRVGQDPEFPVPGAKECGNSGRLPMKSGANWSPCPTL
jgi:hypothetical protein